MNETELTQTIIDMNKIIANILKSQVTQLEYIHELNDRIVELEKEKK